MEVFSQHDMSRSVGASRCRPFGHGSDGLCGMEVVPSYILGLRPSSTYCQHI
jgi:hypothetical protein